MNNNRFELGATSTPWMDGRKRDVIRIQNRSGNLTSYVISDVKRGEKSENVKWFTQNLRCSFLFEHF